MPFNGIVELCSLNKRERGQLTLELSGHKGSPRPARLTRRSWRACLRHSEEQRLRRGACGLVFGSTPAAGPLGNAAGGGGAEEEGET